MGSKDGDDRCQRAEGARARPVRELQRLLEGEEHVVVALSQPLTVVAVPELANRVVRRATRIRARAMASERSSAWVVELALTAQGRAGASQEPGRRKRVGRLLDALMVGVGNRQLGPVKRAVQRRDEAVRPIVEVALMRAVVEVEEVETIQEFRFRPEGLSMRRRPETLEAGGIGKHLRTLELPHPKDRAKVDFSLADDGVDVERRQVMDLVEQALRPLGRTGIRRVFQIDAPKRRLTDVVQEQPSAVDM